MAFVMTDTAAWTTTPDGTRLRAFGPPGTYSVAAVTDDGWCTYGPARHDPQILQLGELASTVPRALADALAQVSVLVRWRTPDLWEAIAAAVLHTHTHRGRAAGVLARLCAAHGTAVRTPHGLVHLIPDALTVAGLSSADFQEIGLTFRRRQLQEAARAYVRHGAYWAGLPPHDLAKQLQTVRFIGPWTAGAAVADHTHDWSAYHYGDRALRHLAGQAAPDIVWPITETAFATWWQQIGSIDLSTLTVFTLAWGELHDEI